MPRKWQPREMRMVAEYVAKYYREYRTWQRVRLGKTHPHLRPELLSPEEERMVGVFRRWADAVVITEDKLILIEAAIRPDLGDISKLEGYKFLLRYTPEFEEFRHFPVEMQLVYAIPDEFLIAEARKHGIKPVFFRPAWLEDYIAELYPHERRGTLTFPTREIVE